ncbi:CPCC family cysteine-rich protein [Paenibacillus sp. LHD-117]|uniref:CPCC family cysteine-rich protein n=1 Tax=Paenibacillus sp. LHD-117 TaxID=3071412 RepID=UPI0027DECA61|nr:CPCC family cysteine-rich protein [Paenibacillus sp. LHD-117]MDQ6423593.1 CPCC family cysteine-rich protein [Paenibacillus sp. LHD-117]
MNRDEAIAIILKSIIEDLSKEEREEILTGWWGIDQDDPEFDKLPETLQSEILQYDEPQKDAMDEVYNALLFEALRKKYLGVKNEYLSRKVSVILQFNQEVEGLQEELYSCQCCEFKTLPTKGEYFICPVCFWEDDGNVDPNYYSSPNKMTLAQARDNFIKLGAMDESSIRFLTSDRLEMFSK